MIKNDLNIAIKAIHELLIELKARTVFGAENKEIYNLLDDLEYLPILILDKTDQTDSFRSNLKEICDKNNCVHIYKKYNQTK